MHAIMLKIVGSKVQTSHTSLKTSLVIFKKFAHTRVLLAFKRLIWQACKNGRTHIYRKVIGSARIYRRLTGFPDQRTTDYTIDD